MGSKGEDHVRSCKNFRRNIIAQTSTLIVPVQTVFFYDFHALTKRSETSPKHVFGLKWGESGAFSAKNSDATSWHKLVH
jgi:hypothetical protein